jgi:hypothetical protein
MNLAGQEERARLRDTVRSFVTLNACVYCCCYSTCVCGGKEMEERVQGGPSGLVPIWHGVDPAARGRRMLHQNMLGHVIG